MRTIYLAGPIFQCSDTEAHDWRENIKSALPSYRYLDPMARDYRGKEDESVVEIVEGDKEDIQQADILLVYLSKLSAGTLMEVLYGWSQGKRVVVVLPKGQRISPWIRYHATEIVESLEDAISLLDQEQKGRQKG